MNGIDISKWQKGINLEAVPCDFVIIKATQGTNYVSPEFSKQITQAISLNKLVGIYHYAGGGGAIPEAEHFIKTVRPYIGKAILVLDWEGEQNENFANPDYALAWLNYVKTQTGVLPFIYMSKSVCRQYKNQWNTMFPLWCAQYKSFATTGYQENPWTDSKGFGPWPGCQILQYSSKGRLSGYGGYLDLDKAYITADEWKQYASTEQTMPDIKPIIRKGDRNDYVKAWQTLLYSEGYKEVGKIDGVFGEKTEKAVIHYQQDHQMESGWIGPQTWGTIS